MLDMFAEARQIALLMQKGGSCDEARSIQDAIECGATGSEILMNLRFVLTEIEKSEPDLGIAEKVMVLRRRCDEALT